MRGESDGALLNSRCTLSHGSGALRLRAVGNAKAREHDKSLADVEATCVELIAAGKNREREKKLVADVEFEARPVDIAVTNLTTLNDDVKENLLRNIVAMLLRAPVTDTLWHTGGEASLSDIARELSAEQKVRRLVSCVLLLICMLQSHLRAGNGLATFLRNHSHVFTIDRNNVSVCASSPQCKKLSFLQIVRLRDYRVTGMNKSAKAAASQKKKACWFYHNHPNKCCLPDEKCSFVH